MSKKRIWIILAGVLILAGGIFFGSKYIDNNNKVTVTVPIIAADTTEQRDFANAPMDTSALSPEQTFPASAPATSTETSQPVSLDVQTVAAAPAASETVKYQYQDIGLQRVDYSGDYWLPDGVTPHDVQAVYLDGQQVSPDRMIVAGDQDRLDVFDAQRWSKVRAVVDIAAPVESYEADQYQREMEYYRDKSSMVTARTLARFEECARELEREEIRLQK